MRPGQLTPENDRAQRHRRRHHRCASMRPGQLTPENSGSRYRPRAYTTRFNEAGAINPGKRWSSSARSFRDRPLQ